MSTIKSRRIHEMKDRAETQKEKTDRTPTLPLPHDLEKFSQATLIHYHTRATTSDTQKSLFLKDKSIHLDAIRSIPTQNLAIKSGPVIATSLASSSGSHCEHDNGKDSTTTSSEGAKALSYDAANFSALRKMKKRLNERSNDLGSHELTADQLNSGLGR